MKDFFPIRFFFCVLSNEFSSAFSCFDETKRQWKYQHTMYMYFNKIERKRRKSLETVSLFTIFWLFNFPFFNSKCVQPRVHIALNHFILQAYMSVDFHVFLLQLKVLTSWGFSLILMFFFYQNNAYCISPSSNSPCNDWMNAWLTDWLTE